MVKGSSSGVGVSSERCERHAHVNVTRPNRRLPKGAACPSFHPRRANIACPHASNAHIEPRATPHTFVGNNSESDGIDLACKNSQ